jgi:hypothetical protein
MYIANYFTGRKLDQSLWWYHQRDSALPSLYTFFLSTRRTEMGNGRQIFVGWKILPASSVAVIFARAWCIEVFLFTCNVFFQAMVEGA